MLLSWRWPSFSTGSVRGCHHPRRYAIERGHTLASLGVSPGRRCFDGSLECHEVVLPDRSYLDAHSSRDDRKRVIGTCATGKDEVCESRGERNGAFSMGHGRAWPGSQCRSVPCVACYLLSDPVKQMNVKSEASRTISPKRPFFKISVLMTNQSCFVAPLGAVGSNVGCDLRAAARRGIPGIRRVFLCFLVCLATCFLSRGARVCAQVYHT